MVDLTREVTANLTPHFRVSVHPREVKTSRFTLEETAPEAMLNAFVQTDIPPAPFANTTAHAKVFAIFDGHGGAEVGRFCQLFMIDVLTNQDQWTATAGNVNVGEALVRRL